MNKLFVFASPIGNISDVSNNFIYHMNQVDVLFCEDTRITKQLLSLLNINRHIELISYHKFNESKKLNDCIELIHKKQCGLISDAGYPNICDPGYILIDACYLNNINVVIINGPSSITHALAQCGFDVQQFIFLGFLHRGENNIIKQIKKAMTNNCAIVFFEAVHRINNTIAILKKMQLNTRIYIGRELTKKFETIIRCHLKDVNKVVEKGEFVVILENANAIKEVDLNKIKSEYQQLISFGLKSKDACKFLAIQNKTITANEIYRLMHEKE